jgi:hypothetical protein
METLNIMTESEIKSLYNRLKKELNNELLIVQNEAIDEYYICLDGKPDFSFKNLFEKICLDIVARKSDYLKKVINFVNYVEDKYNFDIVV